jgi:3-hydroxyacyl-CoA dehydrogenase / enoyl-CoA hydratase / 3-hydroxybutyryl-CoA epimerase
LERVFDELGISAEDRRRYPAYGAIMKCVVGGWYKAMEDAGNWEMDCFVDLIRDPTAGNMIRSLFLERQRAAKLIPQAASNPPARAVVQGVGAEAVRALLRASRVEIVESDTSPPDCIVILTDDSAQSTTHDSQMTIRWLQAATPAASTSPAVWVSELTPHGRAVEVIADAQGPGKAAGLQIARWLRATPLVSQGASFLGALANAKANSARLPEDERLLAIALAAADLRSRNLCNGPAAGLDTGIADTAAVVAGLFPAYAGGPFTYLRQHGHGDAD